MIDLPLILVVILGIAVIGLAAHTKRLHARHKQALRRIEADFGGRLAQLEAGKPPRDDGNDVRDLAAMVDGVASVGMRLERRIATLEAQAREPSRHPDDSAIS